VFAYLYRNNRYNIISTTANGHSAGLKFNKKKKKTFDVPLHKIND